mmetsp:Transcript_21674/g.33374  ORF Transcript_21674/g.33374 Transcript_21674/m.33374 type:complete len:82 (+) Transcript_21674:1103-1348(+)
MMSVFNCHRSIWRNLKMADLKPNPQADKTLFYPHGSAVYPVYDPDSERLNRILLLGGVDMRDPINEGNKEKLAFTEVHLAM